MSNVINIKFRKKKYRPRAKPAMVSMHMRLNQEDLARLQVLAQHSGMSTAEYMRGLACVAITEHVLLTKSRAA
ncbi:hypothetical protein [Pseudoxanthomonas mexicana]